MPCTSCCARSSVAIMKSSHNLLQLRRWKTCYDRSPEELRNGEHDSGCIWKAEAATTSAAHRRLRRGANCFHVFLVAFLLCSLVTTILPTASGSVPLLTRRNFKSRLQHLDHASYLKIVDGKGKLHRFHGYDLKRRRRSLFPLYKMTLNVLRGGHAAANSGDSDASSASSSRSTSLPMQTSPSPLPQSTPVSTDVSPSTSSEVTPSFAATTNSVTLSSSSAATSKVTATPKMQNISSASINATTTAASRIQEEKKEDPRVMILIRLLFLSYYGSLGSLMPFLPVYYQSLGHGGQIIGMLGAVKPFTTFLVAPLWGLVSDQTDCPFFILKMTFLVSLVGQLLVGVRHEAWYIMAMVFITAVFNAPVKSLIDSMVMEHIVDQSSYGRLRLWGQMGFGLGSSGVGVMLSKSQPIPWDEITNNFSPWFENAMSKFPASIQHAVAYTDRFWKSLTGYKLLFLVYAGLSVPTYLCMQAFRRLDAEKKRKEELQQTERLVSKTSAVTSSNNPSAAGTKDATSKSTHVAPTNDIGKGFRLLAQNTDALLFFFLILCIGVSSGIIENFAYVRIREVGGAGKEMGMSRLVSSLAGAPMFWFSGSLTNMFGVDRILIVSLLSYVTRFLIYAAMQNPYQGLPAEALRGLTFAAFWSSATIYAHKVSPAGLHATMLMLLNAMYGGLGQSLGAILGGKLQHKFGTVWTFTYSALADLILVGIMIAYLSTRTCETSFTNPTPIVDRSERASCTANSDDSGKLS